MTLNDLKGFADQIQEWMMVRSFLSHNQVLLNGLLAREKDSSDFENHVKSKDLAGMMMGGIKSR